jgi:class 3 adenylate cyclase
MAKRVVSPVLVGRDHELSLLEDSLVSANLGESRFVVLAGEAGMGKTRLATELTRRAKKLGSTVLWGSCSEAELSLPYLPFIEAIGNYLASTDLAKVASGLGPARGELAQIFPQLAGGAGGEESRDPEQAKPRLFEAFVSLLSLPAAERALLLVVEDVHWADGSTRELLDYLARRLTNLRSVVLVTYRSDELDRRHPLVPVLQAWRRSGLAETIELDPLSPIEVAEVISAIFDREEVTVEFRDLMHERSEGNPFVLGEMLKEGLERGDIYRTPTGWERKPLQDLSIPNTVRETILFRLGRLESKHAGILQSAAVLGRNFQYPMLVEVSQAAPADAEAALEAATNQQLVEEAPGEYGLFRWCHALTQEAIYTDMVLPRRQQIHSRAADVLATRELTRPIDLATHLLGAGRFAEAVPVCIRAAEEAERTLAYKEAAALYERILPHTDDARQRGEILSRTGHAYWMNAEPSKAAQFLEEGIGKLEELGDQFEAARHRLVLGRCYWERQRSDLALAAFEHARGVLEREGPSGDLASAYMRIAALRLFELDWERGREGSEKAVSIAEAAGADYERVWSLSFLGLALIDLGEVDKGADVMDRCFEEAIEKGYFLIALNVAYNDIWDRCHLMLGDLETRIERLALLPAGVMNYAGRDYLESYIRRRLGNLPGALEAVRRSVVNNERLQFPKMLWRSRVELAEVLTELGQIEDAEGSLPSISERADPQDIIYDSAAQIRCRIAADELDQAIEAARSIVDNSQALGGFRATLSVGVEAFVAAEMLDEASFLIEIGRAHRTPAGIAFLDQAEGRLLLAKEDPASAVSLLERAIGAFEKAGYRLEELRSQILLAEAKARLGKTEEALSLLSEVIRDATPMQAELIRDSALETARRLEIPVEVPQPAMPAPLKAEEMPVGERLVTSMFADVRGYTAMTAASQPEEMAERIGSLYRWAKQEVERHSGIIGKFAGDAVMATFNVSKATLDHCEQALRAALALRDKAALMDLQLGIGIAVGPAVVGEVIRGEDLMVSGVATNLAARLQAEARGGEILLSDEAYRRVDKWLAEHGIPANQEKIELKGFDEPQDAYRIQSLVKSPRYARS